MKRFRLLVPFAIIVLLGFVLVYPAVVRALSAPSGGGAGTAAPTAVPSMSVPTSVATTGNVLTMSTLGSISPTTHDAIVCEIDQGGGANSFIATNNMQGWFEMNAGGNAWFSGNWDALFGHCVQSTEPASYTFQSTGGDLACMVLRHTNCGQDVNAATANAGAGITLTCNPITTGLANSMIIIGGQFYDGGTAATLTGPAGYTLAVNVAAGAGAGYFIGYKYQAAAGSTGAISGTLTTTTASGCNTAAFQQQTN